MINKARLVDCAEYDCGRTFATRSPQAIQYCPNCRLKRVRASQRRFDERERDKGPDKRLHHADTSLERRLDSAEFSVLEDAGPEDEAFRPGARLTTSDVLYMLRHEAIAVNSLFLHNKSKIQYRVVRGAGAKLVLTPEMEDGRLGDWRRETGDRENWRDSGKNRVRFGEKNAQKDQIAMRFGEIV